MPQGDYHISLEDSKNYLRRYMSSFEELKKANASVVQVVESGISSKDIEDVSVNFYKSLSEGSAQDTKQLVTHNADYLLVEKVPHDFNLQDFVMGSKSISEDVKREAVQAYFKFIRDHALIESIGDLRNEQICYDTISKSWKIMDHADPVVMAKKITDPNIFQKVFDTFEAKHKLGTYLTGVSPTNIVEEERTKFAKKLLTNKLIELESLLNASKIKSFQDLLTYIDLPTYNSDEFRTSVLRLLAENKEKVAPFLKDFKSIIVLSSGVQTKSADGLIALLTVFPEKLNTFEDLADFLLDGRIEKLGKNFTVNQNRDFNVLLRSCLKNATISPDNVNYYGSSHDIVENILDGALNSQFISEDNKSIIMLITVEFSGTENS